MRCTCYRVHLPELLASLTDPESLAKYQGTIGDEIPSIADRAMIRHLRRMSTFASRALADGFDALAQADVAGADELLSDMFAVATYHGWALPAESLGELDLPVEELPRGMLGADRSVDSARVWMVDQRTIALSRSREAGETAEMGSHPKA